MNFNKVFLSGRLTRDPEMRFTPTGSAVTEGANGAGSSADRKAGAASDNPVAKTNLLIRRLLMSHSLRG